MECNNGIAILRRMGGRILKNSLNPLIWLLFLLPASLISGLNVSAAPNVAEFLRSGGYGMGVEGSNEGGSVLINQSDLYVSLLVMVLAMVAIIALLLFISANLVNLIRVREGKEGYSFSGTLGLTFRMFRNRYVAIFGNFVILLVALTFLTKTARGVGLHQGYMPEQPIKYSHALHAGKLKIDCQYCHSGASQGKNAWIPSVNVCWNCHKVVKEGPKYGTEEIAKIEKAVTEGKPIEWIRIHNVPDHAYFNHKQHVVVAGVACQTCHGPVEEMEDMYQFANLSMGWCITCHRETEVNKDVYRKLGLFPELMKSDKKKVTAADIGAINCARCHY